MARANPNQRTVSVHAPQFIDPRAVIPPVGVFPGSIGLINPSFRPRVEVLVPFNPPVVAPAGFTLNPSVRSRVDEERSQSLLQFMANEGLVPSPEEELKRKDAIMKLKQIVLAWIKNVAWQHQLPRNQIMATCATILTYGSYGLGVHGSESDIDALCVGPRFANIAEDFFVVLHNMLQNRPEVSDIHCVKDAKVPLMRFKFNGISIDLPYAQLKVLSVPENVNILNPFFLRNIDETSWKSLSGVRANMRILQLVPNLENFQAMLRCLKLWARKRGVYGNLFGFFGGVHLAILAAFICQRHPNASLNLLILKFFETFTFWPWPTPVMLLDGMMPMTVNTTEMRALMPIMLPCSPNEYCHSNITGSTFQRIRAEFVRGHAMTRDLLTPDFDWSSLFEPFPYTKKYSHFVRIFLSTFDQDMLGDWVGWVKSRFRTLLVKLEEEVQGLCDPNPTEYVDPDVADPNVVFYWGLQPGRSDFADIDFVEEDFMKNINNGYQGSRGRIELSIVEASELPKSAQFDTETGKGLKASWMISGYTQQGRPIYSLRLPPHSGDASELPKRGQFDTRTGKGLKPCWMITGYTQQGKPIYSLRLPPHYGVGYVAATNGDTQYPTAGG